MNAALTCKLERNSLQVKKAAEEYLRVKKVPQLFKSLAVGLSYHKPQDEKQFLIACLDIVAKRGWENVEMKTFISNEFNFEDLKQKPNQRNVKLEELKDVRKTKGLRESSAEIHSSVDQLSPWFHVLRGSLSNLPDIPSNVVRVFISSTFSDFKAERNVLLRESFPVLQQYCATQGLDFQVVDLRWGVTDEVINDHQVSTLCLKEIQMCQKLSVGPNFVAMIGDRYGYRPFPTLIDASEFETLMSICDLGEDHDQGVSIVKEWYQKDENAVPSCYIMQSIASKLPHFHSREEHFAKEKYDDQAKWEKISKTIQKTLRDSAQQAKKLELVDQYNAEKYFISVTEDEVIHGLLNTDATKTLCVFRSLLNLDNGSNKAALAKFTDMTSSCAADTASRTMLTRLKSKLNDHVGSERILNYETQWNDILLEDELDSHEAYFSQFSTDFVDRMKQLVDNGISSRQTISPLPSLAPNLELEVLHHAHMAVAKGQVFCGREDILNRVQQYIQMQDQVQRQPLVLHGVSGQGKTALMAVLAARTPSWCPPDSQPVVILRFLGTTPASSDIFSVLQSVVAQISKALEIPVSDAIEQMSDVCRVLIELLLKVSIDRSGSSLVIFLDSVDQLSGKYGANLMSWLPRQLPRNVFIIVSVLSEDANNCLQNIQSRLTNDCLLQLDALSIDSAAEAVQLYLQNAKRKLTDGQLQCVNAILQNCRQPLFLKLILDKAVRWSSFTEVNPDSMPMNVHSAILQLFESVEKKYGKRFVSHSLAYLTSALDGITDLEMEDVLSCDDLVLDDVYRYHDPPLEGSIRVPSLMWSRVHEELREYLVERQVDGKNVLSWYHRQFWEAAEKRYLNDAEKLRFFHCQLASIYQQECGVRRTIKLEHRRKVIENADRKVSPQPVSKTNVRKLRCLPYHLFKGGAVEQLKEHCLVNFQWLTTCFSAFSTSSVVRDYKLMSESDLLASDTDVELISDLLQLSYDSLRYDTRLFAYHVVERLSVDARSDQVKRLIGDAAKYTVLSKEPRMFPTHSMMFDNVNSPLRWTVMAGQDGIISKDGTKLVCAWVGLYCSGEFRLQVMNLSTLEIIASVKVFKYSPVALTNDGRHFAYITANTVEFRETDTGEVFCELTHNNRPPHLVTPRCMSVSHDGRFLVIGVRVSGQAKTDDLHTRSDLTLFDLTKLSPGIDSAKISEAKIAGKKAIVKLMFSEDDSTLTAICANSISVYSIPDMLCIHHSHHPKATFTNTVELSSKSLIAIGIGVQSGGKVALFNSDNFAFQWSPLMSADNSSDAKEQLIPFGIALKQYSTTVLFGTRTKETKSVRSCGQLWLWSINTDELTKIVVSSSAFWKYPSSLLPLPHNNQHVVIGWSNGDLSLFDINRKTSVWDIHAHGRTVNSLLMYSRREDSFLSFAADNCIKMWCVNRMLSAVAKQQEDERQEDDAHAREERNGNDEDNLNISVSQTIERSPVTNDSKANDNTIDADLCESNSEENDHSDSLWTTYESDERNPHRIPTEDDDQSDDYDRSDNDDEVALESAATLGGVKRKSFKGGAKLLSNVMVLGRSSTTQTLNPSEQCVDANVFGPHLITATPNNRQAPKFWHLTSGILDSQMSNNFNDLYNKSLTAQGITYGNRCHAQILCFNEYLVYLLKKTNAMTLFISKIINNSIEVLAHVHIPECYFSLIVQQPFAQELDPLRIFTVRTSCLEIRNFRLEVLETIDLPNLADEINNLTSVLSSANKKKILNYRVSITSDDKYFVITNPTPGGKSGRYFDVVDLERKTYIGRSSFGVDVPWITSDGVYYLILPPSVSGKSMKSLGKAKLMNIQRLSQTIEKDGMLDASCYCSLLRSANQQLSPDGVFVAEFSEDYTIHVWRIADRQPKMMVPLAGHVAQVSCVSWLMSSDVLVSGSHDSSVRLWSLSTGSQLCLFHVYGAVENVRFSDELDLGGRFVVVHCIYAPFRKRAVILKVTNVT